MTRSAAADTKQKSTLQRIGRITVKVIAAIFLFVILLIILIQLPPVQNFARKKVVTYLEKTLNTKVQIGNIYVGLPRNIILSDVFIEDRQKDTLLIGGEINVDISLIKLLNNEIEVNEIHLEDITTKIKRLLPDTVFNFQFIIDAFTPATTQPSADTAALQMAIKSVILDNVRVIYKDVITGNDMDVKVQHLDSRIDTFDTQHYRYSVPAINVKGFHGNIYQSKPLAKSEPLAKDLADVQKPPEFQLSLKDVMIDKLYLDYRNDISAFYTVLNLGQLKMDVNKIDLPHQEIDLAELTINKTATAIRLGGKPAAKIVAKEAKQEVKSIAESNWRFTVNSLQINDNNFRFDNDLQPEQPYGIDYAHMLANQLTLHADNLYYSGDTVSATVTKGAFKEKSGFVLNELQTEFLYDNNQAYLKDLYLKTPGTTLQRSAAIHYPDIEALQNDIAKMEMDLDLQNSKLQVKDILAFAPMLRGEPGFTNPEDVWLLNGEVHGNLNKLFVNDLYFKGLQDTRINLTGSLNNLMNPKEFGADLAIAEFSTTRSDLSLFIPKGALPTNITLPQRLSMRGTLKGNPSNMNVGLAINTSLGNANINGNLQQLALPDEATYNVAVKASNLNVGAIFQMPQTLGSLTADLQINGKGYAPETANASVKGTIRSLVYNQYNYRNMKINGSISNQQLTADAEISDPNIDLSLNVSGDISTTYPALKFAVDVDSIKTQELNLTAQSIIYRGNIDGEFSNTDPNNLTGSLLVTQSLMVMNGQRMQLDTINLLAGGTDSGQFIQVNSAPLNARIEGQYKLTELAAVFQQSIQPYFDVMPSTAGYSLTAPYDFSLNATLVNHPLLKVFVPTLDKMDPVQLQSRFTSDTGWHATITAPLVINGTQQIKNLSLVAGTGQNAIKVNASVDELTNGPGMRIFKTTLDASVANNQVDFSLLNRDQSGKEKYSLNGIFEQPTSGQYAISLKPDSLLLNYEKWNVAPGNKILLTSSSLHVNDFLLNQGNQQISINNTTAASDSPIKVNFSNFQLSTITGFVKQDSLAITGILNGDAELDNLLRQPVFTSDLTVKDLAFNKDTLGNLNINVNNESPGIYAAKIVVSGRGNDILIDGNYHEDGTLNLVGNIKSLQLNTIEGSTFGAISEASGQIKGLIKINGTLSKPKINGDLNFDKAGFKVVMLGSHFTIDNEKISIDDQGLLFNTFTLTDSAGNTAVLDGRAYTSDFSSYRLDLDLKANDFRAINSTKKENKLFYGQLYFNSDLHIAGTNIQPVIDGSVRVNEKTNFTVVLPQPEPGIVEREGIVEFVDKDARINDSLFLAPYDSLNASSIVGFNITTNIEVDREAAFTLVVDQANGDFINLKGEANLTAGIDPSGNVTLAGSYELYEGYYELSFNLLRRKFNIQKGSRILWTGIPTEANVDVTATYIANASPLDLVENQLQQPTAVVRNYYRQKLPFEVYLKMNGELMKPRISFDIVLPEDKNYTVNSDVVSNVRVRLSQLREQPSELNKQVFALLLLNRFVAENPFNNSSDGITAESFARQSVSKLLTEQLNQLASGLIQGVDLNFDVVSASDYTTGEQMNRTDLNVGLSKRLLNDRLKVSVGSNFELEGPQNSNQQTNNLAGDIAVDYQLSKDGRYALRAYRKNEYEGVIDGYVVETGVNFIITLDYDHFHDLFRRKKKEEKTIAPPPENTRPIKDTDKNN